MSTTQSPIYSDMASDPDLAELVEIFVGELPERWGRVEACVAERDMVGLGRVAHQLKGAAGSYGFHCITDAAAGVEHGVKKNLPESEVLAMVRELLDLCKRARAGTGA